MNELGRILRDKREARGLSLGDLAHKLGISQPFISKVEKGIAPFPAHRLKDWCIFVEADPELVVAMMVGEAAVSICKKAGIKPCFRVVPTQ